MNIENILRNPKLKYIIITFLVSAIGFLKSFLLLTIFSAETLGIVALLQTVINTISLMQFGAVTGGYRLFSYKKEKLLERVNSAILMFFIYLTLACLLIGTLANAVIKTNLTTPTLLYFIIIGIVSLYSNWVICKLLGNKKIKVLNNVQLISGIVSFFVVISANWLGLKMVILGSLVQPGLLILITYLVLRGLRPKVNHLSFKKYILKIIGLGFTPYLTSALTLVNSQLGRWIITFSLGTAILGKTYLVTLFVTLVTVFPNAVSNMFFPSIIEKYELKYHSDLKSTLNRQFIILGAYYMIVILVTVFLSNVLVKTFLPKHVGSVALIYAVAPSLVFLHMSVPIITVFNAAKKFKNILHGSLLSVFTYLIMLCLYVVFFKPNLLYFYILESISALFFFIYNIFHFIKITNHESIT